jgi:hypothetical protein
VDLNIDKLGASLKDLITGRLRGFLNANADKKEFIEERTKRLAELTIEIAKASTDPERESLRNLMDTVADTIESELTAVAVLVSAEFRASVTATLQTVLEYAQKSLPIILAAAGV